MLGCTRSYRKHWTGVGRQLEVQADYGGGRGG
jgi:hypothetical protein